MSEKLLPKVDEKEICDKFYVTLYHLFTLSKEKWTKVFRQNLLDATEMILNIFLKEMYKSGAEVSGLDHGNREYIKDIIDGAMESLQVKLKESNDDPAREILEESNKVSWCRKLNDNVDWYKKPNGDGECSDIKLREELKHFNFHNCIGIEDKNIDHMIDFIKKVKI